MDKDLTPRAIVEQLDKHIVGQAKPKRIVAIALRNRLRRRRLPPEDAREVQPKNILMIGPTGVGKTEIARRLAQLVKAPFIKVEATKYTEVGYVGRDVESMARDLVEMAVSMVREEKTAAFQERAAALAEERILDIMLPPPPGVNGGGRGGSSVFPERRPGPRGDRRSGSGEEVEGPGFVMRPFSSFSPGAKPPTPAPEPEEPEADDDDPPAGDEWRSDDPGKRWRRQREKLREQLRAHELDDRIVEVDISMSPTVGFVGGPGMEEMGIDMRGMLDRLIPRQTRPRALPVPEALEQLKKDIVEESLDMEEVAREALDRAAQDGVIFIDEFDKIAGRRGEGRGGGGPDISREGVQRDILPIVEGSAVVTKHGVLRTDHVLFIAAGAFSQTKPSDLIPELQGRFPLRCELEPLTKEDFRRILVEPRNSLTEQYRKLLQTDGVELVFTEDGVRAIAEAAARLNERLENIGARRLHAIVERVLEDISFNAPETVSGQVMVDAKRVEDTVGELMSDEDLQRYIL
jgi:ATP-dependent HslUV protease ATP-binding subunit HslU